MTPPPFLMTSRTEHIETMCEIDTRKRYTDEELVAIHRRCFRWGLRKVKREEDAQDFACWALIAVMEGRPAKVDWLWVDWTRESIGRKDAPSQPMRLAIVNAQSLDAQIAPDSDTLLHEIIPAPEPVEPDPERERQLDIEESAYWEVDSKTRDIVDLWRDGKTQEEIGAIYAVSPSRICQRLHAYRLALAQAGVKELRARAPESVDIDTRMDIEWLTL